MEKGISYLLAVMQRRSLPAIATFAAVIGGRSPTLLLPPPLLSISTIDSDDKRVSISDLGRDLTQVRSSTPGGSNPLADQAELIKSQRVLKRALSEYFNSSGTQSALSGPDAAQTHQSNLKPLTTDEPEPKLERQNCSCYQHSSGELSRQRSSHGCQAGECGFSGNG